MPPVAPRVLLQLSRSVAGADGREILLLLARAGIEHAGADAAAVVEVVEDGKAKVVASEGLPASLATWSTDAETIGLELGEELKAACGDRFAQTHVRPMMSSGGLFGALVLFFQAGRRPKRQQLELADGLVDLAATALSKAVQFDELRRSHEELRASQELLVRTEKLRALGEMAAGISHDLANILNPISLHMELLAHAIDHGDAAKSRERIEKVRQIVRHGSEMLQTLNRFSRQLPELALETVDLNCLAHEAAELAKPRMARPGSAWSEIREELGSPPAVSARPGEVVSALLNVIVNAIDAMPKGGTIVVRTQESRGGALVEVADDGPGMTPEVARRVFEPFFTTKGEAGTGLGLAMVRGCAERHGGTVTLETSAGQGTKIGLWFPPARGLMSILPGIEDLTQPASASAPTAVF